MKTRKRGLKREIRFRPGWTEKEKPGCGCHPLEIWFYLSGNKGTVQFGVATGMYSATVASAMRGYGIMGIDVGYHSPQPMYDGQEKMPFYCEFIKGGCYYDGSSWRAAEEMEKLILEGEDAIWKMLEEEYCRRFGDEILEKKEGGEK